MIISQKVQELKSTKLNYQTLQRAHSYIYNHYYFTGRRWPQISITTNGIQISVLTEWLSSIIPMVSWMITIITACPLLPHDYTIIIISQVEDDRIFQLEQLNSNISPYNSYYDYKQLILYNIKQVCSIWGWFKHMARLCIWKWWLLQNGDGNDLQQWKWTVSKMWASSQYI